MRSTSTAEAFDEETFDVTPELARDLEDAIADVDHDDVVPASELAAALRRAKR